MKCTRYPFFNLLLRCIGSVLVVFTLAVLFPLAAFAQQRGTVSSPTKPPACLQAPANLDVTKLSEVQLQSYGLPLRPHNSDAYAAWLQKANRIKTHHHVCEPPLVTGSKAHHSPRVHHNTEFNSTIWAGNYAIQPPGSYVIAYANWNLPCVNNSTRKASASEWVGLGRAGINGSYLIQDGTDELVDSAGHVSYIGWIEAFGLPDYTQTWNLPIARCGDQVYAEVDSNFDSDGYDYYVVDTATYDFSRTELWPVSNGATGECIVENPNNKNSFPNFTNFNYIAFTGCDINTTGINDLPHDYYNLWNNGHEMAHTGSITGNDNYNVYWRAPN